MTAATDRVAFRITPELAERAEAAVRAVRRDPSAEDHVEELVEVILELSERGMDFYYLEPLRRAGAGTIATSTARLGIAAAGRDLPTIIRRVLASLDPQQVAAIADFVDEILIRQGARR